MKNNEKDYLKNYLCINLNDGNEIRMNDKRSEKEVKQLLKMRGEDVSQFYIMCLDDIGTNGPEIDFGQLKLFEEEEE